MHCKLVHHHFHAFWHRENIAEKSERKALSVLRVRENESGRIEEEEEEEE